MSGKIYWVAMEEKWLPENLTNLKPPHFCAMSLTVSSVSPEIFPRTEKASSISCSLKVSRTWLRSTTASSSRFSTRISWRVM